jgi:excisionase family DNA binding protein
MNPRRPLYVRIPVPAAEKLDRAAFEMQVPKQDLVADLLFHHLPPPPRPGAGSRRVVVESADDTLTVGHHSFVPADEPDVLTAADVAELLRTDEETVLAMADSGELPARRVGDDWRFARTAVIRWLEG